jgi:hypothetical protein
MPSPKVAPYLISQIRFAEGQIQTEKRTKIRDWEKKNPAPKEPKENEVVADIRADRYKLSKPKLEKTPSRTPRTSSISNASPITERNRTRIPKGRNALKEPFPISSATR